MFENEIGREYEFGDLNTEHWGFLPLLEGQVDPNVKNLKQTKYSNFISTKN
eukprot:Awhi_evm1s8520